ncbi:MAG: type II and III secretion system protein [Saprospiraceae bacterium]|nr:type II and III secretion system protein [Saprospiraceae bacterium]
MKKLMMLRFGLLCLLCMGISIPINAQRVVQDYKLKNLISSTVLQQFEQLNSDVTVFEHKEGNRLILVGDSTQVENAMLELEKLDVPQMMVTIEFMLVEYFHEHDFDWGIDITQGTTGNFSNAGFTPGASNGDISLMYNAVSNLVPNFHLNVRALVNEDRAKVMTNPHIAVVSGESATLSVIDRRTIVLETATINGITTTLQNVEAGITLNVTPIPTHDSLIHLDVQGRVSEFLPFSNVGEYLIEENDINTKVTIADGQSLIIGGLIQEETNVLEGGVPFLRKIPLLGLLFKSKKEVKNYVERVMYITPYLHPIQDESEYKNIRKMTPFENTVETIIEQDPQFLKYDTTQKSIKRNRKAARKQARQGNN